VLAVAGIAAAHGLVIVALQRYSAQPRSGPPAPQAELRVTLMPSPPSSPPPTGLPAAPSSLPIAPPPQPPAVPAAAAQTPAMRAEAALPEAAPPVSWPSTPEGDDAVTAVAPPAAAVADPQAPASAPPPTASRAPDPNDESSARPAAPEPALTAAARSAAGSSLEPAPQASPPLPPPSAVSRRFRVFYGDYRDGQAVAELAYSLEITDGRYRLTTEARATGLTALFWSGALTQRSSGRVGPAGLEPDRYVEQRGRRPERWASIDRGGAVASFSGGERVPLVPGTQDRLSALVQLGLIARAQPRRAASGQQIELPELGNRAIAAVRYASLGDEVLSTEDGELRALHLQRRDGEAGRVTTVDIWLGYDQGLMPVRIRLTDPGGRVLDQILAP
jgi:hypothetical protein